MRAAIVAMAVLSLGVASTLGSCTYNENDLRGVKNATGGNRDSGSDDVPLGAGGVDGAMSGVDRDGGETPTVSGLDGRRPLDIAVTGETGGNLDLPRIDAPSPEVGDVPITGGDAKDGAAGAEGGRPDGIDGGIVADVPASGGALGTGGATGTGGMIVSGGASGTGGNTSTGGATNTGGVAGTGGASGAGGTTGPCQEGATECAGNGVRSCTSGQWGLAIPCGPRQTCTGPSGTARCSCNVDPVCHAVGNTCSSASVLATCAQDAQACFYQSSAVTCSNGACTGPAGAASCCTNACTAGSTCLSNTILETCTVGPNGCTTATTTTCPAGHVTCASGACTCEKGWGDCNSNLAADGCEINIDTTPDHCGGCNLPCSTNNTIPACAAGVCTSQCYPPTGNTYADCNGKLREDGCETFIFTDPNNCGACGNVCDGTKEDKDGRCGNTTGGVQCLPCNDPRSGVRYLNCDHDPKNGCETYVFENSENCGECGNICPAGTICLVGKCTAYP